MFEFKGLNSVAAKSKQIEVDGDHFFKHIIRTYHTAHVVSSKCL